jgi:fibronectin type 3 domain-containing protein
MTSRQKTWALLVVGLAVVLSVSAVIFVHSGEKSPKVHKVTLTWQAATASPGKSVASYNVYRGTTSGGPYSKLASGIKDAKYEDSLVSSGTTYYYVVTSVEEGGHESPYSAEIQAKVP